MNYEDAEQLLRHVVDRREPNTDPELEAVRIAILIEDTFDVVLSDADIDPAILGNPAALTKLLARVRKSA